MYKRILSTAILLTALLATIPAPASAASGPSQPGPTPNSCVWQGQLYPHGSLRKQPVYGPFRNIIRHDYYRCANGSWIYAGSSDDA